MSRLNDVISKLIEDFKGENDRKADCVAIASIVLTGLDPEERDNLAFRMLVVDVKRAAQRASSSNKDTAAENRSQGDLFPELHAGYALSGSSTVIKETSALSRPEFVKLIQVREESIAADRAHLNALTRAYSAASPVWDIFPEATFGQICQLLQVESTVPV